MERHIVDTSGTQQKTPRDLPLRRPWHLSHGEPPGSDKPSKRERVSLMNKHEQLNYIDFQGS